MKKLKKFKEWLSEDFAMAGNVQGMGNPAPPSSSNTGSGDTWPSLGQPASLIPLKKNNTCSSCGRKFARRCKCKNKNKK